jgi:hypothetical protein
MKNSFYPWGHLSSSYMLICFILPSLPNFCCCSVLASARVEAGDDRGHRETATAPLVEELTTAPAVARSQRPRHRSVRGPSDLHVCDAGGGEHEPDCDGKQRGHGAERGSKAMVLAVEVPRRV